MGIWFWPAPFIDRILTYFGTLQAAAGLNILHSTHNVKNQHYNEQVQKNTYTWSTTLQNTLWDRSKTALGPRQHSTGSATTCSVTVCTRNLLLSSQTWHAHPLYPESHSIGWTLCLIRPTSAGMCCYNVVRLTHADHLVPADVGRIRQNRQPIKCSSGCHGRLCQVWRQSSEHMGSSTTARCTSACNRKRAKCDT